MNIFSDCTKFKQITTEVSTHLKRLLCAIKTSINENTQFSYDFGSRPVYSMDSQKFINLTLLFFFFFSAFSHFYMVSQSSTDSRPIPLWPIISSLGTFNYNCKMFGSCHIPSSHQSIHDWKLLYLCKSNYISLASAIHHHGKLRWRVIVH